MLLKDSGASAPTPVAKSNNAGACPLMLQERRDSGHQLRSHLRQKRTLRSAETARVAAKNSCTLGSGLAEHTKLAQSFIEDQSAGESRLISFHCSGAPNEIKPGSDFLHKLYTALSFAPGIGFLPGRAAINDG